VKASLQAFLYNTYPLIFCQKDLPVTESSMFRGIECADGWYPILDGLCDVLSNHACRGSHPPIEAVQVKQKLGGLHFYTNGDCDWCTGAVRFGSSMSYRVCEETGHPGILMTRTRWVRTLAEAVGRTNGYRPHAIEAHELIEDCLEPSQDDLPPGWLTIAHVLRSIVTQESPTGILRFAYADESLSVDSEDSGEWVAGAIECARALAIRTDTVTGAMRVPCSVDDVDRDHVYLTGKD